MVSLATGEEVRVSEQFNNHPVTLNFELNNKGVPLIAVWPGDGDLRVEKDGTDVLDQR
jgi:hypothetical protein